MIKRTEQLSGPGWSARTARAIVWLIFAASALGGIAILVFGTLSTIGALVSGRLAMTLTVAGHLPDEADAGTARIVLGSYESATLVLENLSGGTVAVATIAAVVGMLTQAAVAGAIALLAWRLVRPGTFTRSLSLGVALAGGVILIGGIISVGLGAFASWMAAGELNAPGSGLEGFWPIMASVDPGSLGIGFVLLLVGLAFETGEKLQEDNARLNHETEGLV